MEAAACFKFEAHLTAQIFGCAPRMPSVATGRRIFFVPPPIPRGSLRAHQILAPHFSANEASQFVEAVSRAVVVRSPTVPRVRAVLHEALTPSTFSILYAFQSPRQLFLDLPLILSKARFPPRRFSFFTRVTAHAQPISASAETPVQSSPSMTKSPRPSR